MYEVRSYKKDKKKNDKSIKLTRNITWVKCLEFVVHLPIDWR